MSTETMTNQGTGSLIGKLGTWLMIIATIALAFEIGRASCRERV